MGFALSCRSRHGISIVVVGGGPGLKLKSGNAASFAWQLDTEVVDAVSKHGSVGSFFFVLQELGK